MDMRVTQIHWNEQSFLVDTINRIQKIPEWNDTAIIIAYDDSDGWYDHVMPPIVSQSDDSITDALLGVKVYAASLLQNQYRDRCGHGPRLPLLLVSPFCKSELCGSQSNRPVFNFEVHRR